jgi:uncharacterized protein DUF6337
MVAWVGLFALAVVLAIHMRVDATFWGTRLTPGVLLMGGYVAIAAVYAVSSHFYSYNSISPATYLLLAICGLLSSGVSAVVSAAVAWNRAEVRLPVRSSGAGVRGLLLTADFLYGGYAYRLAAAHGGLWSFESLQYLASGAVGHAGVILSFFTVWYAVGSADRKLVRYGIIAASVLVSSFNPVKGWTVIPLVAVALAEAYRPGSKRLGSRPLILAVLGGTAVFFVIYLSRLLSGGANSPVFRQAFDAVFEHLLFYLTAGFFGLNAIVGGLRLAGGLSVLFAPLANLVSAMSGGSYVQIISDVYIVGLRDQGHGGNVYSFYGSLTAYTNVGIGLALAFLILALAYIMFAWTWRVRASAARAASLYLFAVLAFGWFEYYLWHLTPYEVFADAALATVAELTIFGAIDASRNARASRVDPYPTLG